ncbi:MAG: class I SAM-dependent methyltransferase [Frankiaceae bacterium]|nr:class I SAM-dependent methyltransferase [Frankiaceae bacterium]
MGMRSHAARIPVVGPAARRAFGKQRWFPAEFADDEMDWRTYTRDYKSELVSIETEHTTRLRPGDAVVMDGRLTTTAGLLPLHPNHRLLYETIGLLAPSSVLEAGCGGGDHLHNLSVLYPHIDLAGLDRAAGQLDLLRQRNAGIGHVVQEVDLTLPAPRAIRPRDLVFTQAVLMHIHTGNGHRVALSNLFSLAIKQVVLMEHWLKHDFWSDVSKLQAAGVIAWPELHPYIRRAPELGDSPHLLVISAEPLDWEPLTDYDVLASPLRSARGRA